MEKFFEKMVLPPCIRTHPEDSDLIWEYGTNVNLYKQKLLDVCANTRK